MSPNAKLMLNIFLPFFAIHCMEQVYFVYGTVLQSYSLSPEIIGWILSCYFIAIMSIRPLGGWLLERFGVRKTLIGAGLLGFAGCSVLLFAKSIPFLLLGRILSGASFGVYGVGIFSYQAITLPPQKRGAALSLITSGGVLPMATITPLGEWFLIRGFTEAYLLLGPLCALACVYFGSKIGSPAIAAKQKEDWGTYGELFSFRPYLVVLSSGAIMALLDASVVCMSLLAAERGLVASYFLTGSAVAAVIVRIAGSELIGLLPCMLVLSPGAVCMGLSLFAISAFPSNLLFLLGGIMFGVGIGFSWPLYLSLIADILPPILRPKGTATGLLMYDTGWILTPLITGYFMSVIGTAWTFRVLSLAGLSAALLIHIFYWVPLYRKNNRVANANS